MAKNAKEFLYDMNFILRALECLTCLISFTVDNGMLESMLYQIWSLHGWFLISLAFVFARVVEEPHVAVEMLLLFAFTILMFVGAFWYKMKVKYFMTPLVIGFLMVFDFLLLIQKVFVKK